MDIAVVIIACNEEKHIVEAIESAKQIAQEIIVVDSGSIDKTVELAEQHGAKVFFNAWENDFAAQRNFAAEKTQAAYLFHLDADERISSALAKSIKKVMLTGQSKIYAFYRENILFGEKFKHGVFRPDKVVRMFPRGQANWQGKVHESLQSSLPEQVLDGTLVHYPYDTWEQYFTKFNKYTTIWAQEAAARGKRTTVAGALLHALFSFFKVTFINLGILDGLLGLVTCCFHFSYTLAKYVKLYKLQKQ